VSATYGVALNRAGINTANSPLLELRAASTARAILRQLKITMAVLPTTAPRFVLARPTNTPAGGTNNTPIAFDNADAAALSSLISTGWTTAPTFNTSGPWLDVGGLPLTLGAGLIWTYPGQGLVVPTSGALILANLNASGATLGSFDVSAVWEE
jgi:hypothetical protein